MDNSQFAKNGKQNAAKEFLKLLNDPSIIIFSDWLKVRGILKNWIRLYCILKPGLLVLYSSEKIDKYGKWVGTILLSNCKLIERTTKKSGFCFKLFNPLGENIWNSKGLNGEKMGAITVPLPSSYLILRASNEEAGKCWIDAINMATQFSGLLTRSLKHDSTSSLDKFKVACNLTTLVNDVPPLTKSVSVKYTKSLQTNQPTNLINQDNLITPSKRHHNISDPFPSSKHLDPENTFYPNASSTSFNNVLSNLSESSLNDGDDNDWKTISNATTPSTDDNTSILLNNSSSSYSSNKSLNKLLPDQIPQIHLTHQEYIDNEPELNIDNRSKPTKYVPEYSKLSPIVAIQPNGRLSPEFQSNLTQSSNNKMIEETLPDENKSLIWALVKQMKPGMDLSKVTLPTFILEPRSFLDKLSDNYYHSDILFKAQQMTDPYSRIKMITKWYLSGFYNKPKGLKKPYNPVIGEVFRCMWKNTSNDSNTFYISEQVSHHPPISTFYVTNRKDGFAISGTILTRSKFYGNSLSAILEGEAKLDLLSRGECYTITMPYAHCKGILVGNLSMELGGKVSINCQHTGYSTFLEFKLKPMFGSADSANLVTGKIKFGENILCKIDGHWDGKIFAKEVNQNRQKMARNDSTDNLLWDASNLKELYSKRQTRYLVPLEDQSEFESAKLWLAVSKALIQDDQVTATEAKSAIEIAQRNKILDINDPQNSSSHRATLFVNEQELLEDIIHGDSNEAINRIKDDNKGKDNLDKEDEIHIDRCFQDWIYRYTDVRPWDAYNDLYQFEENYVIQTKTLHHTKPLPPLDLVGINLLSTSNQPTSSPASYHSNHNKNSSHLLNDSQQDINLVDNPDLTDSDELKTFILTKRQSETAKKLLFNKYRRESKAIYNNSTKLNEDAIKDDSNIQYFHKRKISDGINLEDEDGGDNIDYNLNKYENRFVSAPPYQGAICDTDDKNKKRRNITQREHNIQQYLLRNTLWRNHKEAIILTCIFILIQIFILRYLKT